MIFGWFWRILESKNQQPSCLNQYSQYGSTHLSHWVDPYCEYPTRVSRGWPGSIRRVTRVDKGVTRVNFRWPGSQKMFFPNIKIFIFRRVDPLSMGRPVCLILVRVDPLNMGRPVCIILVRVDPLNMGRPMCYMGRWYKRVVTYISYS